MSQRIKPTLRKTWGRFQVLGLFVILLVSSPHASLRSGPLSQTAPITISETRFENNFPIGLTFEATITGNGTEITAVTLIYGLQGDTSLTRAPLPVEPGDEVTVRYTWETANTTIPPSAPVIYHWEVTDSAGNRTASETGRFYYDDIRFDWQVREDENLAVWWHDRPDTLGERVFMIATESLDAQASLYQARLTFPVRILIYNDYEEFAAWHTFISEFIGGQAFPTLGITTQIVSAYGDQEAWLRDVIPHEISHLFFYQVTASPFTSPPSWLNEGIAQYNEQHSHRNSLAYAQIRILSGGLIPLTALTGSFGNDEEKVTLAYAEGISAVSYFVETYGEEGMGALLAAYRAGMSHDEAFETAIGRSMPEFEQDWLTWLKVPEGMYGTPTPTLTLESRPMPTMMGLPGPTGTPVSQAAIGTATPIARPTSTPPLTREETVIATPAAPPTSQPGWSLCGSTAILGLALAIPISTRFRKRYPDHPGSHSHETSPTVS